MIVAAVPTNLDALRLRSEFLDLPGLTLSVPQAARLLGLRSEHAAEILDTMVRDHFLAETPAGSYHRPMTIAR